MAPSANQKYIGHVIRDVILRSLPRSTESLLYPLSRLYCTERVFSMSITHIVLFQFKSEVAAEVVHNACERMLALKDNCVHPTSQQPYIKSASGGKDNSPEGNQNGITHAFVVEFASAADRDYYVQSDPSHLAFVKTLDGLIEKAQVIDFTDRVL